MVELSPPLQELQCGARRTAPGGHRSPLSVLAHMRPEEIAPRLSHSTRTTAVPSLSKPPAPRPLPTAGPGAPEPGQNAQQQQGDGLRVRCGLKRSPGSRSFPRPSHDAAARLGPDRRPAQLSACPTSRHRLPPWRTPGRTAHSAPAESRRPVPPAPAVPRIRAQPATRRAEGARRPSLQPLPYAGKLRLEGTASTRVPAAGLAPASHSGARTLARRWKPAVATCWAASPGCICSHRKGSTSSYAGAPAGPRSSSGSQGRPQLSVPTRGEVCALAGGHPGWRAVPAARACALRWGAPSVRGPRGSGRGCAMRRRVPGPRCLTARLSALLVAQTRAEPSGASAAARDSAARRKLPWIRCATPRPCEIEPPKPPGTILLD